MKKAVVSADIIQSSRLSPEQRIWLNSQIKQQLEFLGENKFIESNDYELYRGDSFQFIVQKTKLSLKAALLVKTGIRKSKSSPATLLNRMNQEEKVWANPKHVDVRISMAIAEVEMYTGKMATSDGTAFKLSGRKLDEMKKEKQTFYITSNDVNKNELQTEAILVDYILAGATALQCEVIYWKLLGWNEIDISHLINIKQSAVNQRSMSGGWHAIDAFVKRFEAMYDHE